MKYLIILLLVTSAAHAKAPPKTHIKLISGVAPMGVYSSGVGRNIQTTLIYGAVVGFGMDVQVYKKYTVGIEMLSNTTLLMSVGYRY